MMDPLADLAQRFADAKKSPRRRRGGFHSGAERHRVLALGPRGRHLTEAGERGHARRLERQAVGRDALRPEEDRQGQGRGSPR
eukprot:5628332-Pyramimonas_sp.AAC.1